MYIMASMVALRGVYVCGMIINGIDRSLGGLENIKVHEFINKVDWRLM